MYGNRECLEHLMTQWQESPLPMAVGYCDRCGGETGSGCLGGADCDDNMELLRDGVSPEFFRNPVAGQRW